MHLFTAQRRWPTSAGFCLLFVFVKSPSAHWKYTAWIPKGQIRSAFRYQDINVMSNIKEQAPRQFKRATLYYFFENLLKMESKIVLTLTLKHAMWFVFTRPDIVLGHAVRGIKVWFPVCVLRAGLYTQTWEFCCTTRTETWIKMPQTCHVYLGVWRIDDCRIPNFKRCH